MGLWEYLTVVGVGAFAGAVNAVAGAGALLTFPVLVGLGLSPYSANVTNSVGITFGNISAAIGFRAELTGQSRLLARLVVPGALGSLAGCGLLLVLPSSVFTLVAPGLVVLGSVLTLAQPVLARRLVARGAERTRTTALAAGVFLTSLYGGYFGSGVGVIFLAVLGLFLADTMNRLNAGKTVLQAVANGSAGLVYCFVAPVDWRVAALLAVSSAAAAPLGAWCATRISPLKLRYTIGTAGLLSAAVMALH